MPTDHTFFSELKPETHISYICFCLTCYMHMIIRVLLRIRLKLRRRLEIIEHNIDFWQIKSNTFPFKMHKNASPNNVHIL